MRLETYPKQVQNVWLTGGVRSATVGSPTWTLYPYYTFYILSYKGTLLPALALNDGI